MPYIFDLYNTYLIVQYKYGRLKYVLHVINTKDEAGTSINNIYKYEFLEHIYDLIQHTNC